MWSCYGKTPGLGSNIKEALLLIPFQLIYVAREGPIFFRSPISGVDYSPRLNKWELWESKSTNGGNLLGQVRMRGSRLDRKKNASYWTRYIAIWWMGSAGGMFLSLPINIARWTDWDFSRGWVYRIANNWSISYEYSFFLWFVFF